VCSYLYWAYLDGIQFKFPFDEEDNNICQAVAYAKVYYDSQGLEDLNNLGTYEFLEMMQELVRVVKNSERFDHQPVFSKYHRMHFKNIDRSKRPTFPKFIQYSSHAETIEYFLEGMKIDKGKKAGPGSSLFFEFFKKENEFYIRTFYKDSPEDEEQIFKLPGQLSDYVSLEKFAKIMKTLQKETNLKDRVENECHNLVEYREEDVMKAEKFIQRVVDIFNLDQIGAKTEF